MTPEAVAQEGRSPDRFSTTRWSVVLAQDFSLLVLEGNLLKRADPSRGRFRSLLLVACLSSAGEMPAGPTAKVAVQLHDQVIRRSSCACIRQGCVGRTRTLKP